MGLAFGWRGEIWWRQSKPGLSRIMAKAKRALAKATEWMFGMSAFRKIPKTCRDGLENAWNANEKP